MQKKYSASLTFSIAIAIVLFICASCKKSSDSKSTTCTLSAASIVGTWGYKSVTYQKTPTSPIIDVLNDPTQFPVCQKDNTYIFSGNGQFTYNDVGVICNPNSSYTTSWTFSSNTIQISNLSHVLPVTSFDCQTMVITINDYDTTGDKEILTFQKD